MSVLPVPLSGAQYATWLDQQAEPDVSYAVAGYVRVPGPLDPELLAASARRVGADYVSPRTRIVVGDDGTPQQIVDEHIDFAPRVIDLPVLHGVEGLTARVNRAIDWMRAEAGTADSATARVPVIQRLIQVGADHWLWYIRAHRVILDDHGVFAVIVHTAEHYSAAIERMDPPRLRPRPLDPAGLVAAEQKYLASTRAQTDEGYWARRTPTLPAPTPLTGRRAAPSPINLRHNGNLDHGLGARLTAAAEQHGTTAERLATAAFGAYVAQMSGRDETLLALPVPARVTAVARVSAGSTANTLPLAIRLADAGVGELARRVDNDIRSGLRHQLFPASKIGAPTLRPDAAGSTCGDSISMMFPANMIRLGPVGSEFHPLTSGPVEDVAASIRQADATGFRLDLEMNPACGSPEDLRRHHERFHRYLDRFVTSPAAVRVADLELLDAHDVDILTGRRRASGLAAGPDSPGPVLPELFRATASAVPDTVAIQDADRSVTYRELDAMSERVAGHLAGMGARPERTVLLRMRPGLEYAVAVWAVAKTGAALVPVDPRVPGVLPEHISDIVNPVAVLDTDDVYRMTSTAADHGLTSGAPRLDNPAYLLVTASWPSPPRAVAVTHHGLAGSAEDLLATLKIKPGGRIMHFASTGFHVSVLQLLVAAIGRSTLVIPPTDATGGAGVQTALLVEHVTAAFLTPAIVSTLDPDALPELTSVAISGGPVPRSVADAWGVGAPGRDDRVLLDLYSPTGIHGVATADLPAAGMSAGPARPLRGNRVHLLGNRLRPVPAGAVGEIYLSGTGTARGYHGDAVATASQFVANPNDAVGERMYRTGDLARWNNDGRLEFVDCAGGQAVVHGFRVDLEAVDAVLMTLPGVERSVTRVIGAETPVTQMISYVEGAVEDSEDLRGGLAAGLPWFAVPDQIVLLDAFPLTANGNVDDAHLPVPDRPVGTRPESSAELAVAQVFADAVGGSSASEIDMYTSLFELGGNAATAHRVAGRLSAMAGRTVTADEVLVAPRIAALTALVGVNSVHTTTVPLEPARQSDTAPQVDSTEPAPVNPSPPESPRPTVEETPASLDEAPTQPIPTSGASLNTVDVVVPLMPAQEELWRRNRVEEADSTHHIRLALDLSGDLDVPALWAALADVVYRHAPLRTVYPVGAQAPMQRALPAAAGQLEFTMVPLKQDGLDDADQVFAAEPFDLATQVPMRARLFELDGDRYRLLFVLHQIAADGPSMVPLVRDLATAYSARLAGRRPEFVPLSRTFTDYAIERQQTLQKRRKSLGQFWLDTLDGAPAESVVPPVRPRSPRGSRRIGTIRRVVDTVTWTKVGEICDTRDVTPFQLVHAALTILLSRLGAGDDIVIGTSVAGRDEPDLDDLIGMFVNSVPLRTQVVEANTFAEHLEYIKSVDIAARAHSEFPFEDLVRLVEPTKVPGRGPIFQVVLTQRSQGMMHVAMPGVDVNVRPYDIPISRVDLEFILGTDSEIELRYSRDMYPTDQAAAIIDALVVLLSWAVRAPDTRIGMLPVLGDDDRHRVHPASGPAGMAEATLAELLRAAAQANPEAPAAVDGARLLRYTDLYQRSSRLAALLVEVGVRPGDPIITHMPRSLELLTVFWAIALAGGAVAALDPRDPTGRIGEILSDSSYRLGITDRAHEIDGAPHKWLVLDSPELAEYLDGATPAPDPGVVPPISAAAYIIHGAGTDDRQAPVVVTHRGLSNLTMDLRERMQITADARILAFASPAQDTAIMELLMAAGTGATLVVVPESVGGGTELEQLFIATQLTHAFLPAEVLGTLRPDRLPDLGHVMTGGMSLPAELAAQWRMGRHLYWLWGAPETTVTTTVARVTDDRSGVGAPIRGTSVVVLDARLRPVPIGVPGELYVLGSPLALGYRRDTAATAARFVANPLRPGDRMYRTGHLVRWVAGPDGDLELDLIRDDEPAAVDADSADTAGDLMAIGPEFADPRRDDPALLDPPNRGEVMPPAGPPALLADDAPSEVSRSARVPLSSAQERLWLLDKVDAGATYHLVAAFEADGLDERGGIDDDILRQALHDLVMRHETLRSSYLADRIGPYQQILEPVAADLLIESVADVDTSDVDSVIAEFVDRPFQLDTELPIRAQVIRTSDAGTTLVLVIHRIAADVESLAPLSRDLQHAYRARGSGGAPGWPALRLQYADHATWQRRQGRRIRAIDHFVTRLRDAPAESTFAEDRPRPVAALTAAGEVTAALRAADRYALSGLARNLRVSEFSILHAGLVATLHRMAGLDDVVIGTRVSGRNDACMRDLVGPFGNLVALRTSVDPRESFEELLHRVDASDAEDLAEGDAPFDRVVAAVVSERIESAHPVFGVLLTERDAVPEVDGGGLRLRPVAARTTPFDVAIDVAATDDGMELTLRHRLDLYGKATATAILDRYLALLSAAVSAPGTTVGALPILLPGDINDLAGGGPHVSVAPMPLRGILDRAVRRAADAPAVDDGERTITYGQLDDLATDLAVRILEAGVRRGDRVGVVLDRSVESVIAFWAVSRVGAIHVAVDAGRGRAAIDRVLRVALPQRGIAIGRHDLWRTRDDHQWVDVEPSRSVRPAAAHADDLPHPESTDPAYLVFPSGITASGVLVGQRGLAPFAESVMRAMGAGAQSRILHAAVPGSDASILEMLLAAWATAPLVIAPDKSSRGSALVDFLGAQHITHLYRSAAALAEMPARELPDLATIAVGGGAPHVHSAEDWSAGRRLLTMYTAAEVGIAATSGALDPVRHTLGSPFARTQLLVCDERLEAMPPGAIGELYVAGPGVAQGYSGDAAGTACRFVANPYARTADQERMFRTGVLARWRMSEDGTAVFDQVGYVGDRQFVRGYRIPTTDVVRVIESHPDVRTAALTGAAPGATDPGLIAYVTSGSTIDADVLRTYVAKQLPHYLVPDEFVSVATIPRLPDGRPDRRSLPVPPGVAGGRDSDPAGIVRRVARVLAEVIGVPVLGPDDDFFGRGGTSLQAALAVERLRNEFGAEDLMLRSFLDNARVGAIAARVAASATPPSTSVRVGPITDHLLPLRPADGGRSGHPTVFCVHSVFGVAWQYTGLGPRLDPAIPLVGVQAQGIATPTPPPASIAELARGYVTSIRGAQSEGPYVLVGWALGGLIAHAMGCELRRLGEEVRLVLLDAYPVADSPTVAGQRVGTAQPDLAALVSGLVGRAVDRNLTMDDALDLMRETGGAAAELDAEQLNRLYDDYLRDIELERHHTPQVFDGDVVFYRATREARRGLHVGLWAPYVTGEVEVRDFDVTHDDLGRSPAIDEIGAELNDIVREPISTRTAVAHRAHMRPAPRPATSSVVEVHNVSRIFGAPRLFGHSTTEVRAIDGISLSIGHGRCLALLGPNGAGKTTIARIIAGLDRPTSGVVLIDGLDAAQHPRQVRGRIGMSGQHESVDEKLTGAENLTMFAQLHRLRGKAGRARAAVLAEQFGLSEVADRRVDTYSAGMRRRLDLAVAQVTRPSLVILDEPTAGLDPQSRRELWEVIGSLGSEGTAVLLTTQYLDEADELADDVAILDQGRIVRRGTTGALKAAVGGDVIRITLADPTARYAARAILARQMVGADVESVDDGVTGLRTLEFRAADGPRALADAVAALTREGVEVATARVREATLDDVFFALTGTYRRGGPTGSEEPR